MPDVIRVADNVEHEVPLTHSHVCCRCGATHEVTLRVESGRVYKTVRSVPDARLDRVDAEDWHVQDNSAVKEAVGPRGEETVMWNVGVSGKPEHAFRADINALLAKVPAAGVAHMRALLETAAPEALQETFDKYLPKVLKRLEAESAEPEVEVDPELVAALEEKLRQPEVRSELSTDPFKPLPAAKTWGR